MKIGSLTTPPLDTISRSAMLLVVGRAVGLAASFAIGIVLARMFAPAVFGTYKQFFLVYMTLYGLAQLGMAESLYYFVPRNPGRTGRYVCNALVTLAGAGLVCMGLLFLFRDQIAERLTNTPLADYMVLLGLFLTFMLMSTVLEIVMVSRKKHFTAAVTYALPFALAVGVEVIQVNYHQYVVASRFDAATFAVYAIGCLQIPLVDLIMTSTVNVLMVKMAEEASDAKATVGLWHDTVCRLAFLLVPLTVLLLVVGHDLIVGLFTNTYAASVPIFMVWTLTILPSIFAVDAVLRAFAQTRFLLIMNLLRLGLVALLIGWFLSSFGLTGAVLITLLTTTLVRGIGVLRIARLLGLRVADALPWARLSWISLRALVAAVPVLWLTRSTGLPPLVSFVAGCALYCATYALLCYLATLTRNKETLPCAA